MPDSSLLQRLKERKLVQWAIAYLAGAWVLFEATDAVGGHWNLPGVFFQGLSVVLAIGFFVALVLAWYHGEKGRQRVSGPELLMMAALLVTAGVLVSVLPADEEAAEAAGLSDLARFAALDVDRPTIAVLPLANLSAREENSYFAAGIHEELLRLLSLVRELGVISRTSVLQYAGATRSIPEIAAELGARYIVEGSVQEDRGRVRIQVQLIDATTDQHLWADRYDRSLEDIFELQSDVAQAIAEALEAVITPNEQERIEASPTQNPTAYDLYLRAVALDPFVGEEYDTRVDLLRGATRLDPEFSLAHATLALDFWNGYINYRRPPFDSAVVRADLAVRLDPTLPQALAAQGFLLTARSQDEAAEALLQRALTLDPNNYLAWSGLADAGWKTGEPVTGALAARRALAVSPRSTAAMWQLGTCLSFVGMYDEANLWNRRVLDLNPRHSYALLTMVLAGMAGDGETARVSASQLRETGADFHYHRLIAALFDLYERNLPRAEALLSEVVSTDPDQSFNGIPSAQVLLGWVMAQSGRPEDQERLQDLRRVREEQAEAGQLTLSRANDLAVIASELGDEDEQVRWFLEATRLDDRNLRITEYTLRDLPFFDGIRSRSEYRSWLQETERRMEGQRRELAAMGPWTPDEVLERYASDVER